MCFHKAEVEQEPIQILHGFAALSKNPATQNTHDVPRATKKHNLAQQSQSVSMAVIIIYHSYYQSSIIITDYYQRSHCCEGWL